MRSRKDEDDDDDDDDSGEALSNTETYLMVVSYKLLLFGYCNLMKRKTSIHQSICDDVVKNVYWLQE